MGMTVIIGVESTAHTLGVSVVKDDEVLSNETKSYETGKGGMVPSKVSNHHVRYSKQVLRNAIRKSGISIEDVDGVAFSQSPGIGNCLRIGSVIARTLQMRLDVPLIPVNHCIAHIEIGKSETNAEDPVFLYASGANTQIINYENSKYRIYGETEDMGVGNFLDSVGRKIGLGFPAGPKIEELAKETDEYYRLPYSVKGMDIILGGIFSHVKQSMLNKYDKEVIANSIQETVFAMLVEVTERAVAHSGKDEVLIGGGVGCNDRLKEMLRMMCDERDVSFHSPSNEFLVDNGAMIARTGVLLYESGKSFSHNEMRIDPDRRPDDVEIPY